MGPKQGMSKANVKQENVEYSDLYYLQKKEWNQVRWYPKQWSSVSIKDM